MTNQYRKPLPNSDLEYYDTRQAVNDITPDAYDKLPYTSRILAEQLVRKVTDSTELTAALKQLINRERTLDFPWYPARVVYKSHVKSMKWTRAIAFIIETL